MNRSIRINTDIRGGNRLDRQVVGLDRLTLSGRVVAGVGEGAAFTQLKWVREQCLTELGIDPHPGTLNLLLDTHCGEWIASLQQQACHGPRLLPPDPRWCEATCYPVRVADRVPGAIVRPGIPGYPDRKVELISALPLRETLALRDEDSLAVEISVPLRVRAVIFDVDGTLLDSLEAYRVVAERAAAPLGIRITRAAVSHALNTGTPFWDSVVPAATRARSQTIEQLKNESMRQWPEVLRKHGRIFPRLIETLNGLAAKGARLGIMTDSHIREFHPLHAAGLFDNFAAVIAGGDGALRKPHPEGLLKCAAALGVTPHEAVYVGDTPLDVQASRAAGMASVSVLSGAGDSAQLSAEGPDWIIESHSRVPGIVTIIAARE